MAEQHDANALPLRDPAIQCLSAACPCPAQALLISALPLLRSSSQCHRWSLLFNAFTKHILALPMLCSSYPCQCSAMLYHSPSVLVIAMTLHHFSMPLLRYARLDLSVQCLSDTILVIAFARRFASLPLQNYLCFAFSRRFTALTLIKHFPLKSAFAGIAPLAQTVIASEVEPVHDTADKFAPRHNVELDI